VASRALSTHNRKRSEALPVHMVRSTMNARRQVATGICLDDALDGGSAVCRFCLLRSPLLAGWKIASHWINEKKLGSFCQNSFKLQLLVDILFTFYFCELINRAVPHRRGAAFVTVKFEQFWECASHGFGRSVWFL
jgi:hypothetical protein